MPGETFFMAFGGLGISLAGFAGLISALDRSPGARSPIAAYRVRNIVVIGFWLSVTGLGTVALYTATTNSALAIRVGTGFLSLTFLGGLAVETRRGPAWPDERERRVAVVLAALMFAVCIPNLIGASAGYLQLLMIMALTGPISIFYNTVRAAFPRDAVAPEADAGRKPGQD